MNWKKNIKEKEIIQYNIISILWFIIISLFFYFILQINFDSLYQLPNQINRFSSRQIAYITSSKVKQDNITKYQTIDRSETLDYPRLDQKSQESDQRISFGERRNLVHRIIFSIKEKLSCWKTKIKQVVQKMKHGFGRMFNLFSKDSVRAVEETSLSINDHVEVDLAELNLSEDKLFRLHAHYQLLLETIPSELKLQAGAANIRITKYLVYQYMASTDWSETYNGVSYVDSIISTIEWRYEIYQLYYQHPDFSDIQPLIQSNICYLSNQLDIKNRSIIYFKIGNNQQKFPLKLYLKLLIITIDRAVQRSIEAGSGEFITIIDFNHFTFQTSPSFIFFQECFQILKLHYPHRVANIFIVNISSSLMWIWNLMKNWIPIKVQKKVFLLSHEDISNRNENTLILKLGKDHVEQEYGGNSESNQPYSFS